MTHTITEKEFPDYIKTIRHERWVELFEMISQIKKTKEFGYIDEINEIEKGILALPYFVKSEVVNQFLKIVDDLQLIIPFDWTNWDEGRQILSNPNAAYNKFDLTTLCKLITVIVKMDKFYAGYLTGNFNDGTMLSILIAMKDRITG